MVEEFHDPEEGGFFYTGTSHETLIARQKDAFDNATPSGNAMAATALGRLAALTGRADLDELARSTLRSVRLLMEKAPTAAGQSLIALDFFLGTPREFAVVAGDDPAGFRPALLLLHEGFDPHRVIAPSTGRPTESLARLVPLLADRPSLDGQVTTYLCENFACQAPFVGLGPLGKSLRKE